MHLKSSNYIWSLLVCLSVLIETTSTAPIPVDPVIIPSVALTVAAVAGGIGAANFRLNHYKENGVSVDQQVKHAQEASKISLARLNEAGVNKDYAQFAKKALEDKQIQYTKNFVAAQGNKGKEQQLGRTYAKEILAINDNTEKNMKALPPPKPMPVKTPTPPGTPPASPTKDGTKVATPEGSKPNSPMSPLPVKIPSGPQTPTKASGSTLPVKEGPPPLKITIPETPKSGGPQTPPPRAGDSLKGKEREKVGGAPQTPKGPALPFEKPAASPEKEKPKSPVPAPESKPPGSPVVPKPSPPASPVKETPKTPTDAKAPPAITLPKPPPAAVLKPAQPAPIPEASKPKATTPKAATPVVKAGGWRVGKFFGWRR